MSHKILKLLIILLAFSSVSFATDYYVSPDGSATFPACTTESNPCEASSTSLGFLDASAGDTVFFLDGTYSGLRTVEDESNYKAVVWKPRNSGTENNPIVFKALNRRQALLIGLKNTRIEVPIFGSDSDGTRSWIVFEGFVLTAVDDGGDPVMAKFNLYNTNNVTVHDCEIVGATHSTGGGINYEGVRIEYSDYVTVSNCDIHGWKETSQNHNTSGIKTYGSYYGRIFNNNFTDNHTNIYLKGSGNGFFSIYNNWIYGGADGMIYTMNSGDHHGHTVYNNLFVDQDRNVISDDGATSDRANDLTIYSNTFYHTNGTPSIIFTSSDLGHQGTAYNNIFYNSGDDIVTRPTGSKLKYADHNIYYPSLAIELSRYDSEREYSSLSSWQSSGELTEAVDVGCGSSNNPGCGSLVTNPDFTNGSGNLNTIDDFEVINTYGRDGGLLGADVSIIGAGEQPPPQPPPSEGSPLNGNSDLSFGGNSSARIK